MGNNSNYNTTSAGNQTQIVKKDYRELNIRVIKWIVPIISGIAVLFILIFWLGSKLCSRTESNYSIIYPLSIVAIGAVAIIALIVGLAIINRPED